MAAFKPGAVFQVPAGDDFAYAVMLGEFPYVAFYTGQTRFDDDGAPIGDPMFVLLVERSAYSRGGWGKSLRRVPVERLIPIPRFFWQDITNKANCKIADRQNRRRTTATPADCVGLEPEAIWAGHHIASRITDTYAGRPNAFTDSLQLKL